MTAETANIVLGYFGPVDESPPGFEIIRPAILILEVIGVFPHIAAKQRGQREGSILVGGLDNAQSSVPVINQPGPAGAELTQCGSPHG